MLNKNYSTVIKTKAVKCSEILGGNPEDYYGVLDSKEYS